MIKGLIEQSMEQSIKQLNDRTINKGGGGDDTSGDNNGGGDGKGNGDGGGSDDFFGPILIWFQI